VRVRYINKLLYSI